MSGIYLNRRARRITVSLTAKDAREIGDFLYLEGNDEWGLELVKAADELEGRIDDEDDE